MTTSAIHCENCGAASVGVQADNCAYCGARLPERWVRAGRPEPVAATTPESDRAARFAALRAHPDYAVLQHLEPERLVRQLLLVGTLSVLPLLLFAIVFFGLLGWIAFSVVSGGAQWTGSQLPAGQLAVPLFALAVIVLVVVLGFRRRAEGLRQKRAATGAPVDREHLDAVWIEALKSGRRSVVNHVVTLEDEGGELRQYPTLGQVARGRRAGEIGVALLNDDVVEAFRAVPV